MDTDFLRCDSCATHLDAGDFERGLAYRVAEKQLCAPCVRKLIPTLSPEEQRAFQLSCALSREDW